MDPSFFFGGKPFCRLSEAVEAVESIPANVGSSIDIVVIPPEATVETDEEEADDDATEIASTNDVCGT